MNTRSNVFVNTLVMGTRGSPLALAQSRQTAAILEAAHPGLTIEERIIRTGGDRQQSAPLPAIGGKGLFTLELEQALLSGEIDFAIHSLKDLPPELPEGLCLAAIPKRAPACDVCVLREEPQRTEEPQRNEAPQSTAASTPLPFLPIGARVGTSSLRRSAQLLHLRPDLHIESIRGNIDTRLRKLGECKLSEQSFDAIVLARAGLERLGLLAEYSESRIIALNEHQFVPSPGQGALAIEARAGDERVLQLLQAIEDAPTRICITAERAAMRALNAGCSTPLGARAVVEAEQLQLWAVVLSVDGRRRVSADEQGRSEDAASLGRSVARKLVKDGANTLLQS